MYFPRFADQILNQPNLTVYEGEIELTNTKETNILLFGLTI